MSTPSVALLGTGIIGSGMSRNLHRAGIELRVWNRTRAKAEALGVPVAETAAEAARGAGVVMTVLSDAEATEAAIRAAAPDPGTVWVQCATVGVEGAAHLGTVAEELGLGYLDAPVLGTKGPAEAGQLVVLASGSPEHRGTVAPVLDAVASRVLWLGAAGTGSRLKLVVNNWVLTIVEGVAESLTLARALGLDPQLFLDTVAGGALDAPYVQLKGGAMLRGEFDPQFPLWGAAKDARLIVEAAATEGVDLAVARALRDHFERAVAEGHGDLDMAATYLSH